MTHEAGQGEGPPFGKPIGKPQRVRQVRSKPFMPELAPELIRQLEMHGCTVQQGEPLWTITFPAGTLRQELFPRAMEVRCELTLPDGYQLSEVIKRDGLSYLFFLNETLPADFLRDHADLLDELRGGAES